MLINKLALSVLVTAIVTGCATDDGGGDGGGGDGDGDVPFTDGVSTLAGMAEPGYVDGARKVAQFNNPVNVLYRDGKLYVADFDNSKLRVIDTTTHVTSTVISQPGFRRPFGMVFAPDGTFYVSTDFDQTGRQNPMSGTIWRVDLASKTATVVANAIGKPRGLAMLPSGKLVVADYLHHVIQTVDVATGQVTLVAGTWDQPGMIDARGGAARFSTPYNIVVRSDGQLMVTDFDNHRIRLVNLDGTTATLSGSTEAGFVDGTMSSARFSKPQAMSVAANGDVYVTDLGNYRVRRIVGDRVETVAGNGQGGYLDSDDPLAAQLYGLEGLSVVPDGSMLYIADGTRGEAVPFNRVRQVKLN